MKLVRISATVRVTSTSWAVFAWILSGEALLNESVSGQESVYHPQCKRQEEGVWFPKTPAFGL